MFWVKHHEYFKSSPNFWQKKGVTSEQKETIRLIARAVLHKTTTVYEIQLWYYWILRCFFKKKIHPVSLNFESFDSSML